MKNTLLSTALSLLTLLLTINASAVTAISSGNWSSAATWDGPVPGGNVSNQNINIPEGITVTLDMNVTFSGLINSFGVDGRLVNSGSYGITMDQGSLTGGGDIDIYSISFATFSSNSFAGEMDVDRFTNNGATLFLTSAMNVRDTMDLRDGSLFLNAGALLQMMTNSTLRMDDGSMSIGTGGVFSTQSYNVLYVGASKTSGIEFNGSMVRNLTIDLNDDNQSLTLAGNVIVSGDLDFRRGNFNISGRDFTLNGDMRRSPNATFQTDGTTNMTITGNAELTDGFRFTANSAVNDIIVNRSSNNSNFRLLSSLTVNGDLDLRDGNFNIENGSQLVMAAGSRILITEGSIVEAGGTFNGSNDYDVEYLGTSRSTGRELSGSGVNNIGINLIASDQNLTLTQSIISRGNFRMDNGRTVMNGYDLTLNGTMNQRNTARFVGNSSSSLIINTTNTTDDSIYFDEAFKNMKSVVINKQNGGDIILSSGLTIISQLNFQKGRMDIGNNSLIMQSASSMIGYNRDRYIITSGQGSVQQMITTNTAYTTFPVGTRESYSPASVQQANGGSSGMFMVRAARGVYENANTSTGTNYASSQSLLDRTWFVESTSGMTLNTNLRLGWDDSFEMNGFDRTQAYISHYTAGSWDQGASGSASAGADNTFFIERNGFTSLSPFTVMDVLNSVGVKETVVSSTLDIYPNPSSDYINVSNPFGKDKVLYEIIDLTGKIVLSTSNDATSNKFDIGDLQKGYYMVKTTDIRTNTVITKKLIKS